MEHIQEEWKVTSQIVAINLSETILDVLDSQLGPYSFIVPNLTLFAGISGHEGRYLKGDTHEGILAGVKIAQDALERRGSKGCVSAKVTAVGVDVTISF